MSDGNDSINLNLSKRKHGLWLVKVPKYIGNRWEVAEGKAEVGKLRIIKNDNLKSEVSLILSDDIANGGNEKIPKDYQLDVSAIADQTLGIFSQEQDPARKKSKLSFEGKILQRLECRPNSNQCYINLKLDRIRKAAIPLRQTVQLEHGIQNYKPISNHKSNMELAERKKAQGKNVRKDKEKVLDMLFKAFQEHQFYTFSDLVKLTKQPIAYLKEILREYCDFSRKPPHRNMWELKPENRHYDKKDSTESDSSSSDDSSDVSSDVSSDSDSD